MQGPMRAAGALLLAAACAAAQAQAIYRCGNTYGSQPCADGKALDTPPPPSAADRSQAAANVRRDAQLADNLQKERLRREAQAQAQAGTAIYLPPPAAEPDRPAEYKRADKAGMRKPDLFVATVPGTVHAKKGAKEKKESAAKPAKPGKPGQLAAPVKAVTAASAARRS